MQSVLWMVPQSTVWDEPAPHLNLGIPSSHWQPFWEWCNRTASRSSRWGHGETLKSLPVLGSIRAHDSSSHECWITRVHEHRRTKNLFDPRIFWRFFCLHTTISVMVNLKISVLSRCINSHLGNTYLRSTLTPGTWPCARCHAGHNRSSRSSPGHIAEAKLMHPAF